MSRPFSRVTSYDVARLAGVSQSAVSRCFKPGASVSRKMREKVMKAANELNYTPNAIARGLITRRSNMVAVVVSSRMNFYYPELLFQLTDKFSDRGVRVLLFNVNQEEDVGRHLSQIWQYQADGVISAAYLSIEQHRRLRGHNIPVVMFNRYFDDYATNSVWCDAGTATSEMIDHLINFGHRRFALLNGPEDSMVNRERMRLVRQALKRHDLEPVTQAWGNYRYESAAVAVQEIRNAGKKVTAIIAANDMMAMGALDEIRNVMGLSVPGDVSVVGFDGINAGRFASYELTTIRQPIRRMTEAAVAMLVDRMEEPDTTDEKRVLTGAFVQGTSTGQAPA
ncbi:MAG: LacI family DNA-binding transcriptional regulator [Hyphomonadaceae bacterium]|nr:LacI family DNA-binding transcriptional regulator [Hyphomonadaceae bacterium]